MKKTTFLIIITVILIAAGCSQGGDKTEIKVHLTDTDYLHLKYPDWFEQNEGLDKEGLTERMIEEFSDEIIVKKEEAIAILGKRIEAAAEPVTGLSGLFNKTQLSVVALDEIDTWLFTINRKVNSDRLTTLLEAKFDLGFWETYDLSEIWDNLAQVNFLLGNTSVGDELMLEPDTTGYGENNPLFRFLYPMVDGEGNVLVGSAIGNAQTVDTAIVNRIFSLKAVSDLLPRNLKLLWSSKPSMWAEDLYTLIAIKEGSLDGKSLLRVNNIVSASVNTDGYPPVIDITMNSEGAMQWFRITSDNTGRELAITVNGSVIFHPRVTQAIESGATSIFANFTEEEATDLAILIDSGTLPPLGVKVSF